jgi:hypothetical protein
MATNFVQSTDNTPFNAFALQVGGKRTVPLTDGTYPSQPEDTGKIKVIKAVNDSATITNLEIDGVDSTRFDNAVIDQGDYLFAGQETYTSITVTGTVWLTEIA